MIALLLHLGLSAHAVSPTDLPPALRGDVALSWASQADWAGLSQDTATDPASLGRRRDLAHQLGLRATFAPVEGIAVVAGFDHLAHRQLSYSEGRRMLTDPATGYGSSARAPTLQTQPEHRGSGLLGWTIGVAFAPFAERYAKEHPVSWRLDLQLRSAPPTTFWEIDHEGLRGAGAGGPTVRAVAAFSRNYTTTEPYLTVDWSLATPRFVDTTDGWGEPVEIQVDPGQQLDVRAGLQVPLSAERTDDPSQTTVDLDLHTGFYYQSARRVVSGVLLPDVLASSRRSPAVTGEQLGWQLGAAFNIALAEPAYLRVWSRALWVLPYRVEHLYPVTTSPDSLRAGFGAELVARWR